MSDSTQIECDELALRELIEARAGRGRVVKLERRPFLGRTSYPIDELCVEFEDGSRAPLLLKLLGWRALPKAWQKVKPRFLHDPRREEAAYHLLRPYGRDVPCVLGTLNQEATRARTLVMERVPGVELWQVGDLSGWQQAVRRVAALHEFFLRRSDLIGGPPADRLIPYHAQYYHRWARRATRFLEPGSNTLSVDPRPWEHVCSTYNRVVERLVSLPLTLVHGECYASNVLIQQAEQDWKVWFIDWETAATGPGLMDLAALIAGTWTEAQKSELALSYYQAVDPAVHGGVSEQRFLDDLRCCRLHMAMRWLGWSRRWSPPEAQRQDWLAEAVRMAGEL